MNRRKLRRRTELARTIACRWQIVRYGRLLVDQVFMHASSSLLPSSERDIIEYFWYGGRFPGGRRVGDEITYDV